MIIKLLKARDNSLQNAIKESLKWCHSAYIGVSYANYEAFRLLKKDFENFLRNNGKLRVLFDIEKFFTDKDILEEFATIPGDSECKVFLKVENIDTRRYIKNYHPKLYLFYNDEHFNAIIGSSNFTAGGLRDNIECNLSIYGKKDTSIFKEIYEYFQQIWNLEYSINILSNEELLNDYRKIYSEFKKDDIKKTKKLTKLKRELDKKVNSIIESQKKVLNENFAYLLGLISANSEIDLKNYKLVIDLFRQTANKGKSYEGYYYVPEVSNYKISQYEAHKKDVEIIVEKLNELKLNLGTKDEIIARHIGGFHFKIFIKFDKNSLILKELRKYSIKTYRGKTIPFIPEYILKTSDKKIIMSFLRGYCDIKSRISGSDSVYRIKGGKKYFYTLRIGISISHNTPELLRPFSVLFKKIGVTKGISFSDPKKRVIREYLIRINVKNVPYKLLGTHWRRIFLKDFIEYINKRRKK